MNGEGFWDRIIYRKEYKGKFEKDGRTFVKYVRKKRFKAPDMRVLLFIAAVIVAIVIYLYVSNLVIAGK